MILRTTVNSSSRRAKIPLHAVIGLLVLCGLFWSSLAADVADGEEECDNPDTKESANKIRILSKEELAGKIGVDEPAIWLSIIGEVYDVTKGNEYYAQGSGYGVFAGRDASVAFMTGNFTPEEAEKSLDVLKNSELIGVVSWRDFYRDHEVYQFVGLLEDERYYDAEGKPTQPMIELGKRIKVAQQEEEVKAKERAIARKKRKEAKAKAKLATK